MINRELNYSDLEDITDTIEFEKETIFYFINISFHAICNYIIKFTIKDIINPIKTFSKIKIEP